MKKTTVKDIVDRKGAAERLTMLTAYDAPFARLLDEAGIDIVLVGDSVGNVLLGYDSTVPVTMEEMLHHARAASRGIKRALLIGDMPFLSYQVDHREAVTNAGRFLKEAGCDGVKLEGGLEMCDTVRAIARAGIPVMGHIGLTPQTASQLGGYKVQGRDEESARRLMAAAKGLEEAGAFAMVMECVPTELARLITEAVSIPTIGIGAGRHCDGQVLVTQDLLGMFDRRMPSFVKPYAKLAPRIREALATFREEVRTAHFPDDAHSFCMRLDPERLLDQDDKGEEQP
jgi:3-methyl-2-oxobutanoate hydroxymethyltransferase